MEMLGPKLEDDADHGPICTWRGVLLVTREQMVTCYAFSRLNSMHTLAIRRGGLMGFGNELGQLLFEIPVYRMPHAVWHSEVDESVQQFKQLSSHTDPIKRHEHGLNLAALNRGYQPAAYNQVVAWLRLVWDGPGPAVKGYAYQVSQQRIVRNFKPGRFNWCGKVLEAWFTNDDTSKEIAISIRKRIANTGGKGNIFHRRYIDLEAFDSLAPHLDWRSLLGIQEG